MHTCHVNTLYSKKFFLKSDDANRPNQPTGRKRIEMDNFYKNCPIWLRFGMQVSFTPLYRVSKKKVLHKIEEKMHKKMKITYQRAKNLVRVQQHYSISFYEKIFFYS